MSLVTDSKNRLSLNVLDLKTRKIEKFDVSLPIP